MRLKRKWQRLITVLCNVFVISFCLSFSMLFVRTHFTFTPDFFNQWLHNWGVAYCVAFPVIWFIQPIIGRLVNKAIKFID